MRNIEEIIASRPVALANKQGIVSKAAAKRASEQRQSWWAGLTKEERQAWDAHDEAQRSAARAAIDSRIIAASVAQMERSAALGASATSVERMSQDDRDLMAEDMGDYSHRRVR